MRHCEFTAAVKCCRTADNQLQALARRCGVGYLQHTVVLYQNSSDHIQTDTAFFNRYRAGTADRQFATDLAVQIAVADSQITALFNRGIGEHTQLGNADPQINRAADDTQ